MIQAPPEETFQKQFIDVQPLSNAILEWQEKKAHLKMGLAHIQRNRAKQD